GRPGRSAPGQFTHQEQRDPSTHRRADHDLRALAEGVEHAEGFLEPAADRAVGEDAAGFAMTGVIEAHASAAVRQRPRMQGRGLGAIHVGIEATEPEQPGPATGRGAERDPRRRRADLQKRRRWFNALVHREGYPNLAISTERNISVRWNRGVPG